MKELQQDFFTILKNNEYELKDLEKVFKEKTGIYYNDFYTKYYNKLLNAALKIIRNIEDARDIVNEGLIVVLLNINNFNPEKARIFTARFFYNTKE